MLAGLFFDGPEAEGWLRAGLSIYARELPEQILADGAHFELSPMYHAIILEDLLDLINVVRTYGKADGEVFNDLPRITARMRLWLAAMTHPDGGLSYFNDAAFGVAANRAELEAYAARLGLALIAEPGEGLHHLAASGYIRVNYGEMAAILDLAAIGPDYIPGHAHADTLSFELSLGKERIVVNGGTSTYAPGRLREAERATAAHSTVEINGQNSSEVWASFRVARRARVRHSVSMSPVARWRCGLPMTATGDCPDAHCTGANGVRWCCADHHRHDRVRASAGRARTAPPGTRYYRRDRPNGTERQAHHDRRASAALDSQQRGFGPAGGMVARIRPPYASANSRCPP